ncbi:Uncharacterized protein dnm_050020 [Desulfonema magnum]|uniref:Uncharacterized protein n=1 Tax=Desulfonema magnum TaxID=45655 RepID=A0A975BNY2_9BACT|nr:Uncharacterized protein dnm_050020 [Desulfonema magnum]
MQRRWLTFLKNIFSDYNGFREGPTKPRKGGIFAAGDLPPLRGFVSPA